MMIQNVLVDVFDILFCEVVKIFNVEIVDIDVGIGEFGIDLLNIVELIVFCEQFYGLIDLEVLNIM